MGLIYFISSTLIGLSAFCKEKQSRFLTYTILGLLILLLSLRTSPDEYLRYINEFGNWNSVVNGFPLSEPLFNLICLICSKTSHPLFWLYLTSYCTTFFLIIKGLRESKLTYKSIPICISFYLSHWFLSLGYISIRGSLANAFCFYGACLLFSNKNFSKGNLFIILGVLTHIQTTLLLFAIYIVFILQKEKTVINKIYKFVLKRIYFILPLAIPLFFLLSGKIEAFTANIFSLFIDNDRYNLYISDLETNALYLENIFQLSGFFNLGLQGLIIFLYLARTKLHNKFSTSMLTLSITGIFTLLIFYNYSFVAFRFASGFLLFNIPLIGFTLEKKRQNIVNNSSISLVFMGISLFLLFFNILLLGRFANFSI